MTSWWPTVRAILVALHLTAITLMALPSPGAGLSKKAWADPTVQEEFAAWHSRLTSLGYAGTSQEFQDQLWTVASSFQSARDGVLTPFEPYYRYAGTAQSWKMFVAPHRYPTRLHIDVDRGEGWVPLYVGRSDEFDWHREQFDHDRMRSVMFRYGWPQYRRNYGRFTKWVGRQVKEEDPTALKIRTRFFKYRTLGPEDTLNGVEPKGRFIFTRTQDLKR